MQADGRTVAGTFTWQEPDTVLDAGTHASVAWKFTPRDTKTYVEVTGTVAVQVNRPRRAPPSAWRASPTTMRPARPA